MARPSAGEIPNGWLWRSHAVCDRSAVAKQAAQGICDLGFYHRDATVPALLKILDLKDAFNKKSDIRPKEYLTDPIISLTAHLAQPNPLLDRIRNLMERKDDKALKALGEAFKRAGKSVPELRGVEKIFESTKGFAENPRLYNSIFDPPKVK